MLNYPFNVLFCVLVVRQKEQMMKKNGGKLVDERELFHGTDHSIIDVICEQNFDWRTSGVNATLYGQGESLYCYIKSHKIKCFC